MRISSYLFEKSLCTQRNSVDFFSLKSEQIISCKIILK